MTENCVIILLNAPQPDKINPVMRDAFGPERACHIYMQIARDVFALTKRIKGVYPFLVYNRTSRYPDLLWLDSDDPGFLEPQAKTTPADWILNAAQHSFRAGAKRVALLSVESPGVPEDWIKRAFNLVSNKTIVVGPSHEGGVYLFAACSPYPPIFEDYPWASKRACDEIVERAKRLRFNIQTLPEFYSIRDERTLQEWAAMKEGKDATD